MLRRTLKVTAVAAVLALPSVGQAQAVCAGANSCSLNPTASLTIPKLVVLGVTSSTVTLNTPNFATDSLNAQTPSTTYGGISVRANHPWTLNISSAAANWTYAPAAGAAGGVRVREDLEFQVNCAGAWADVTGTGQAIASGAITNAASANVCLRTDFPNDYTNVKNRPGTYTLALTLTLAAN